VLATNRNLEKMVAAGEFRADLYYRINVVSVFLPPLRERREDIPLMVEHFLSRFNKENGRKVKVTPRALKVLTSCYWPGNVRELENCVERTATMAHNEDLTDLSFPCHDNRCLTQVLHYVDREDAVRPGRPVNIPITEAPPREREHTSHGAGGHGHSHGGSGGHAAVDDDLHFNDGPRVSGASDDKPEGERERLIWAMEKCGWVQAKAARLLNITPRQMGYALQKYDIEVRKF
jgi:Nif-specific regulatory protein